MDDIQRMDKFENKIDKMSEDMTAVKAKIFNGFSHSIQNTENKIDYIDKANNEAHKMLLNQYDKLSIKFDKLLWGLVSISFLLIVSEIIRSIF